MVVSDSNEFHIVYKIEACISYPENTEFNYTHTTFHKSIYRSFKDHCELKGIKAQLRIREDEWMCSSMYENHKRCTVFEVYVIQADFENESLYNGFKAFFLAIFIDFFYMKNSELSVTRFPCNDLFIYHQYNDSKGGEKSVKSG